MASVRLFTVTLIAVLLQAAPFVSARDSVLAAGPPSGLDVNVINPPSKPVPVILQGTGNISGNVTVTNTPNVNINNQPTVRDADNPARQPVQHGFLGNIVDGAVVVENSIQVPAGKRLVIETVSATSVLPTGQIPRVEIITETGGLPVGTTVSLSHFIALLGPLARPSVSSDEYTGTQPVRLYADPGTTVTIHLIRGDALTGTAIFQVRWSGYLVDVP